VPPAAAGIVVGVVDSNSRVRTRQNLAVGCRVLTDVIGCVLFGFTFDAGRRAPETPGTLKRDRFSGGTSEKKARRASRIRNIRSDYRRSRLLRRRYAVSGRLSPPMGACAT